MNSTAADLESLFNRIADGLASESDEQQLAQLMRSSAESRRAYLDFMELHAALHWDYVAAVSPEPSPPGPEEQTSRRTRARLETRSTILAAFIAGAIVASIVVMTVLKSPTETTADADKTRARLQPELPETRQLQPAEPIAALLVDEVGAEFADGRSPDGVRVGSGEFELLKGIVHLRFAQGADMVLTGPARLQVFDEQHTSLIHGSCRVTAPPTARGFTIAASGVEYVDLGTEFGLRVNSDSGASDLYVFDGQVNMADPQSGEVLSEMVGGDSSRFSGGSISAAPELTGGEFPTPGEIGFHRWELHEAKLLNDPDLVAFYPFRRGADESVLVNGPGEGSMADGHINGARWTTGRWTGKDALLFDRDTDFVELEIPGEHQELTIAVWLKVDRFDFVFNSILNSNGYQIGGIHFQLDRQGFPRGGVIVNGKFGDDVRQEMVGPGNWSHVVSVLSAQTRSQQIYINGVLARERHWNQNEALKPGLCRLGNWLSDEGITPAKRALRGRIDELVIWKRALAADEIEQLVEAGRPGVLWNKE